MVSLSLFFFVLGCHGDVKNPVEWDGGYFSVFPGLFLYLLRLFFFPPVFPVEAVSALSL